MSRANFNPRPREGSDRERKTGKQISRNFNPRPREGSDFTSLWKESGYTNFNPRPREGSDPTYSDSISNSSISIHAPVKGAT